MGLLDSIEGIAAGQMGAVTDEDHVEDGLDSAEDMLDDAGGLLDDVAGAQSALGGPSSGSTFGPAQSAISSALGDVAGVVDKVNDITGALLSEQDAPAILPPPDYSFSYGAAKAYPDDSPLAALGGMKGLSHIADNAISKLGGPSGLVKAGEALLSGSTTPAALPEWWVHEFHCAEGLNELFQVTVFLVRHEGTANNQNPTQNPDLLDAFTSGTSNLGQELASGIQLERDIEKAFKPGAGNGQDLLDDVTHGSADPATDFFNNIIAQAPVDPDKYLDQTCSVHVKRSMDDGTALTERWFTGICTEFEDLGYVSTGTNSDYFRMIRLVIRPSLWALSLRKNCRIFQDMNAVAIIRQVFKFANIYQDTSLVTVPPPKVPGIPWAKSEDDWLTKREYCVQYNETDLDFVLRLMAEEGISFHFDHQDQAERIVLLDNAKASPHKCKTIDGKPAMITDANLLGGQGLEAVWDYGARNRLRSTRFTLRDFNLSVPDSATEVACGKSLLGSVTDAITSPSLSSIGDALGSVVSKAVGGSSNAKDYGVDAELYQYPAPLTLERDASDDHHVTYKRYGGPNVAKFYDKMARGQSELCEASSDLISMMAGGYLRLFRSVPPSGSTAANYQAARASRKSKRGDKLIVTHVEHSGLVPSTGTDIQKLQGYPGYTNSFQSIVSTDTPIKPSLRPPKPVIAGIQTAVVVDPHLQNAAGVASAPGDATSQHAAVCDDLGRVCVQFHWDRRDTPADTTTGVVAKPPTAASAFIRVAQALAGADWGVQFVPRIGMEVAVGFLDGDPDRPIILGGLYGPNNVPPYPPRKNPDEYTYSGLVTHSFPQDDNDKPRHNHLIFDDRATKEEIFLRAQRALREQVRNDYETTVGQDLSNTVLGDQSEDILGNQFLTVHDTRRKTVTGKESYDLGSAIPPQKDPKEWPEIVRDTRIGGDQTFDAKYADSGDPATGGNRNETVGEWDILTVNGAGKRVDPDGPEAIGITVHGHNQVNILKDDRVVIAGSRKVTVDEGYTSTSGEMKLGSEDEGGGTGLHSTPQGARVDAQSTLRVHATKDVNIEADIPDPTKGVEVVGMNAVHIVAGGVDDEHIGLLMSEKEKQVYLRGRENGVRLQWGPDVYVEIKPHEFTLKAGSAEITVRQTDGYAAAISTPSGTLALDFKGQMNIDSDTKVTPGDIPPASTQSTDPGNRPTMLVENGNDPNAEQNWNDAFHNKSRSASNNADVTNAHYNPDGSEKKFAPPPDDTKPVGMDTPPDTQSGSGSTSGTPAPAPTGH